MPVQRHLSENSRHSLLYKEVIQMASQSKNKLVVPGAKNAIDQMKYEIASEQGVQLGADATARQNGSVGGEITKRLVKQAQQQLGAQSQE